MTPNATFRRRHAARTLRTLVLLLACSGAAVLTQSPHDSADVHYQVALRARQDDSPRVAVDELRKALALDPGHALAHYTLAGLLQKSDPDEAVQHVERAIALGLPEKEQRESTQLRVDLLYAAARREASEVYTDLRTGLMWTVKDNGEDIDWKSTRQYCSTLALRGYRDWRMPTIAELAAMSDPAQARMNKIMRPLTLSGCCPWSSTKMDGKPVVYAFNFGRPWPYDGPPLNCRALCVRSAAAHLP